MTDTGAVTMEQLQNWLYAPLASAGAEWAGAPDQSWEEIRRTLLQGLGLSSEVEHPSAYRLFEYLDGIDDEERRELLGSADRLWELSGQIADEAQAAAASAPDSEPPAEYVQEMEDAVATSEQVATELYQTVLAEMIEEDPQVREMVENDPEFASQLYAYALEKAQ